MEQIPKIIHWCWFGPKKPPRSIKKYIANWQAYLPGYQIIRWDESNFDLQSNQYVKEAYEAGKYAFVSDYVRLWALKQMGGIYLDSDMEVVQPLDRFLKDGMFLGYEPEGLIATCIIGAKPGHPLILTWLKDYEQRRFRLEDGGYDFTPNTARVTEILKARGFVPDGNLCGQFTFEQETVSFYSYGYFPPRHYLTRFTGQKAGIYAIHHMKASWRPLMTRITGRAKKFIRGRLKVEQYDILRKVWQAVLKR
ncbi:MAG: glycosyl transferase [Firmicutes bacterium]|nr:glycosyl transferase [Bacillota bacterium]